MYLENPEKELKHYFPNYATSLELETIMLKLLKGFKKNSSENSSINFGCINQPVG